jgi:hypothetical protein
MQSILDDKGGTAARQRGGAKASVNKQETNHQQARNELLCKQEMNPYASKK